MPFSSLPNSTLVYCTVSPVMGEISQILWWRHLAAQKKNIERPCIATNLLLSNAIKSFFQIHGDAFSQTRLFKSVADDHANVISVELFLPFSTTCALPYLFRIPSITSSLGFWREVSLYDFCIYWANPTKLRTWNSHGIVHKPRKIHATDMCSKTSLNVRLLGFNIHPCTQNLVWKSWPWKSQDSYRLIMMLRKYIFNSYSYFIPEKYTLWMIVTMYRHFLIF